MKEKLSDIGLQEKPQDSKIIEKIVVQTENNETLDTKKQESE